MAGTVVHLQPRTPYHLLAAQFPSSQTLSIPIAVNVHLAEWRHAMLLVRVHGAPTWAFGSSFRYDFFPSAPCVDDPATPFRDTTASPSIQISSSQVGSLSSYTGISTVNAALGAYGDLVLTFVQAGIGATDVVINLSCDLILKA